jgi:hypothetical protein
MVNNQPAGHDPNDTSPRHLTHRTPRAKDGSSRRPGQAAGVHAGTGAPLTWAENHIYRVTGGQITELWPAGGPQLG